MFWTRKPTSNWFHYFIMKILKTGPIPKHVAIIMDGNRRYANKNSVTCMQGHMKGFDKLAETLQWCRDLGIPEVTVYAFSIENFKRSKEEVEWLMELSREKFQRLLDEGNKLMEYGICVRMIGNFSLLPKHLRELVAKVMIITRNNNQAFLNIGLAYTARDELAYTIKDIVQGVENADLSPEDISEDLISKCLYTYNSPNPDLLIRTSGEVRFSDFLMWQVSNSCVYFADSLWPEFNIWDFLSAIFYYQRCYSTLSETDRIQNTNYNIHSAKIPIYIDKLYRERQAAVEKISSSLIQS